MDRMSKLHLLIFNVLIVLIPLDNPCLQMKIYNKNKCFERYSYHSQIVFEGF